MTPIDPSVVETAAATDVGRQRTNNQDFYGSAKGRDGALLLIVADGMGGHAGGATASRVAVQTMERIFASSDSGPAETLVRALEAANAEVYGAAQADTSLAGMGTTGVALLVGADGRAWVGNVGDSRAYRLRAGQLEQLTLDHSLVAELQRRGMLTAEEAMVHPRRNEVLRSLGVEPEVDADVEEVELEPGDQILLCSDGLSGVVSDAEIAGVMDREPPEAAVRQLVDAANARGGPDNVTVQIARIPGPGAVAGESDVQRRARDARRKEGQRRVRARSLSVVIVALLLILALGLALYSWVLLDRAPPGLGGSLQAPEPGAQP